MTCPHLWTYRNARSECIRCHATADDGRGLPHGHYAINGIPLTAGRIKDAYACPNCLMDITPRVIAGKLRILCAGSQAHDIEATGQAMTKARCDYLLAKQQFDYYTILDGLPKHLQEVIHANQRTD